MSDARGWKRDARIVTLRLLPWIVVVGIVGALSYLRLLDVRLTPLRNGARVLLEQGIAIATVDLGNLSRDALVLGQNPALTSAVSSGDAGAMGTALLTFARASRQYAEIAWVDETGRERARAEFSSGLALLAEPGRLRRSAARMPWLTHLTELLPAEARVVPLEQRGDALWLRVASPVYDTQGRQRGLVVITHDFRRTLDQLAALDSPGLDPLQLHGADGQRIGASAATAATLAAQDPELWQLMQEQSRGRREGPEGMWHFQDFLPAEPGPGRSAVQPWYFVAHVPATTVRQVRLSSAWQSGGACAIALAIAVWVTVRRRQIERERERLLADLQVNHRALAAANAQAETSLQQLRQLQDELVQAEKLASLGLLVAGVAHELNTPLGSAKVTASTMARRLDDTLHALAERPADPALVGGTLRHLRAGLDIIDHSLERSGEVIRLFKQLAVDRGAVERRQFALDDVLHDVRRLLGPRLAELARTGRAVALVIEPAGGTLLDSYPGPLGQVIENLLGNALLHAFDPPLDDGRVPTVTVRSHTEPDPVGHGPADDWLVLDVIDNGRGIDAQVLPRIFDPFFTTRRGRGGTGIGLHLCHHFCTQVLGGRILVDCRPGQGCRFTVRIPLQAP